MMDIDIEEQKKRVWATTPLAGTMTTVTPDRSTKNPEPKKLQSNGTPARAQALEKN